MQHPLYQLRAIADARQVQWTVHVLPIDVSSEGEASRVVNLMDWVGQESQRQRPLILPPRFGRDHDGELKRCLHDAAKKLNFILVIKKVRKVTS
jgi:hypothetical protein